MLHMRQAPIKQSTVDPLLPTTDPLGCASPSLASLWRRLRPTAVPPPHHPPAVVLLSLDSDQLWRFPDRSPRANPPSLPPPLGRLRLIRSDRPLSHPQTVWKRSMRSLKITCLLAASIPHQQRTAMQAEQVSRVSAMTKMMSALLSMAQLETLITAGQRTKSANAAPRRSLEAVLRRRVQAVCRW